MRLYLKVLSNVELAHLRAMLFLSLCEKCPNTEIFSGPYFTSFRVNTERYVVFNPNAGKYGPGKTLYLDTFHAVHTMGTLMN